MSELSDNDYDFESCYGYPHHIDLGLKLHLNNVIQSLSVCTLFIRRIEKISSENKLLQKLSIFTELLHAVTDNNTNPSRFLQNEAFIEWNNTIQQNSFDLLMLIINDIYGEKRTNKLHHVIDDWLKEYLPLRILIQYKYYCDCSYEALSPLQSEFSINLSATGRSTKSLQSLVDKYFAPCVIDGRVCDTADCVSQVGKQIRMLPLPLPETICIHLERDDNNTKVKYGNNMIIASKYCEGAIYKDVIYYLKSLICVSENLCYKRQNNQWYSVRNNDIAVAKDIDVLSVRAQMLFYELLEDISMTSVNGDNIASKPVPLVKYCLNDNLHCVIQSLSSCNNLNKWIIDCGVGELGVVQQLMAISNGDVEQSCSVTSNQISQLNTELSGDIFKIVKGLLDHIIKETRSDDKENDSDSGKCTPWQFMTSQVLECYCGAKILMNTEKDMCVNISTIGDDTKDLQALLNKHFLNEIDIDHKCPIVNCCMNKVSRRLLLHHPTPTMMCVFLEDHSDSTVDLSDELKVFSQFSVISERKNKKSFTNEYIVFHLKSAISVQGSKCFRKLNDEWFCVDDRSSESVTMNDVVSCNPCILFYEFNEIIEGDEENEDMEASVSEVTSGDVSEGGGTYMNQAIQSLASCRRFVDWLNRVSDKGDLPEMRTLASLINIANHNMKEDKEVDDGVLKKWNELRCSNIYEFIRVILDGVMNESSCDKEDHPIAIYNCGTIPRSYSPTKWFIDLQFPEPIAGAEPRPLQILLDDHFEIWLGYGELHFKSLIEGPKSMPLIEALPDTICFHVNDRLSGDNVRPALELVVKNISCIQSQFCQSDCGRCCRKYRLRSLIATDGYGYKIGASTISKITETKCITIEEEELLNLDPIIVMYEWQQ